MRFLFAPPTALNGIPMELKAPSLVVPPLSLVGGVDVIVVALADTLLLIAKDGGALWCNAVLAGDDTEAR